MAEKTNLELSTQNFNFESQVPNIDINSIPKSMIDIGYTDNFIPPLTGGIPSFTSDNARENVQNAYTYQLEKAMQLLDKDENFLPSFDSSLNAIQQKAATQKIETSKRDVNLGDVARVDRYGKIHARYKNYTDGVSDYERHAQAQTRLNKAWNGLVKLPARIGLYTTELVAGFSYGGIQALTKGDLRYLHDNALSNMLDDWTAALEDSLPNYVTQREQEMSALRKLTTMNFWADDFLGGVAFLGAAAIPAVAASAIGIGSGGIGAGVAGITVKNVINKGAKAFGKEVVKDQPKLAAQIMNRGLRKGMVWGDGAQRTASWGNFLLTNVGGQAQLEARGTYNESIQNYIDQYKYANGGKIPDYEELTQFMEDASNATAGIYVGNAALLSLTGIPIYGKLFGLTKTGGALTRFGNRQIGLEVAAGGTKLAEATAFQKILGNAYKIGGKGFVLGGIELPMQRALRETSKMYVDSKYFPENYGGEQFASFFDALGLGIAGAYDVNSAEAWGEIFNGFILGTLGHSVSVGAAQGIKQSIQNRGKPKIEGAPTFWSHITPEGFGSKSYSASRKAYQEALDNFNKMGVDQFKMFMKANTTSMSNSELHGTVQEGLNFKNFIEAHQRLNNISDIQDQFNFVVDNYEFSQEQLSEMNIVQSDVTAYKDKLKTDFTKSLKTYEDGVKIANMFNFDAVEITKGNKEDVSDAFVAMYMLYGENGNRANEIGEYISKHFSQGGRIDLEALTLGRNERVAEIETKLREKRKQQAELLKEIEVHTNKMNQAGASKAEDKTAMAKMAKHHSFLTGQLLEIESHIAQLNKAGNDALTQASQRFSGEEGKIYTIEDYMEAKDNFATLSEELRLNGRVGDAEHLEALTRQFLDHQFVVDEYGAFIQRAMADNFFKTKEGKDYLKDIIGEKYKTSEEMREYLQANEAALRKMYEGTVYNSGHVDAYGAEFLAEISKNFEESEELSDRQKFALDAIVRLKGAHKLLTVGNELTQEEGAGTRFYQGNAKPLGEDSTRDVTEEDLRLDKDSISAALKEQIEREGLTTELLQKVIEEMAGQVDEAFKSSVEGDVKMLTEQTKKLNTLKEVQSELEQGLITLDQAVGKLKEAGIELGDLSVEGLVNRLEAQFAKERSKTYVGETQAEKAVNNKIAGLKERIKKLRAERQEAIKVAEELDEIISIEEKAATKRYNKLTKDRLEARRKRINRAPEGKLSQRQKDKNKRAIKEIKETTKDNIEVANDLFTELGREVAKIEQINEVIKETEKQIKYYENLLEKGEADIENVTSELNSLKETQGKLEGFVDKIRHRLSLVKNVISEIIESIVNASGIFDVFGQGVLNKKTKMLKELRKDGLITTEQFNKLKTDYAALEKAVDKTVQEGEVVDILETQIRDYTESLTKIDTEIRYLEELTESFEEIEEFEVAREILDEQIEKIREVKGTGSAEVVKARAENALIKTEVEQLELETVPEVSEETSAETITQEQVDAIEQSNNEKIARAKERLVEQLTEEIEDEAAKLVKIAEVEGKFDALLKGEELPEPEVTADISDEAKALQRRTALELIEEQIQGTENLLKELEAPYSFTQTEDYKEYTKLLNKQINGEKLNDKEQARYEELGASINRTAKIVGAAADGELLTDLIQQKVALESMLKSVPPPVKIITKEEKAIDVTKAGATMSLPNYGLNFSQAAYATAADAKEQSVELSGITEASFLDAIAAIPELAGAKKGLDYSVDPDKGTVIITKAFADKMNAPITDASGNELPAPFLITTKDGESYSNYGVIRKLNSEGTSYIPVKPDYDTAINQGELKEVVASSTSEDGKGTQLGFSFTAEEGSYNHKMMTEAVEAIEAIQEDKSLSNKKKKAAIKEIHSKLVDDLAIDLTSNGEPVQLMKRNRVAEKPTEDDSKHAQLRKNLLKDIADIVSEFAEGNEVSIISDDTIEVTHFLPGTPNIEIQVVDNKPTTISRAFNSASRPETLEADLGKIHDIGYVEGGKVKTVNRLKGVNTTFLKQAIDVTKGEGGERVPVMILKEGNNLIAYPLELEPIESPLNRAQMEEIIADPTLTNLEKASILNQMTVDAGLDINGKNLAFLSYGGQHNLTTQMIDNIFGELEKMPYLSRLDNWLDAKVPMAAKLQYAKTDLVLSEPFLGAKLVLDYTKIEIKGDKAVESVAREKNLKDASDNNVELKEEAKDFIKNCKA